MIGVVFSLYQGFTAFKYTEEMMTQSKWLTREIGEAMSIAFRGLALGVPCEIRSKKSKLAEQMSFGNPTKRGACYQRQHSYNHSKKPVAYYKWVGHYTSQGSEEG